MLRGHVLLERKRWQCTNLPRLPMSPPFPVLPPPGRRRQDKHTQQVQLDLERLKKLDEEKGLFCCWTPERKDLVLRLPTEAAESFHGEAFQRAKDGTSFSSLQKSKQLFRMTATSARKRLAT